MISLKTLELKDKTIWRRIHFSPHMLFAKTPCILVHTLKSHSFHIRPGTESGSFFIQDFKGSDSLKKKVCQLRWSWWLPCRHPPNVDRPSQLIVPVPFWRIICDAVAGCGLSVTIKVVSPSNADLIHILQRILLCKLLGILQSQAPSAEHLSYHARRRGMAAPQKEA